MKSKKTVLTAFLCGTIFLVGSFAFASCGKESSKEDPSAGYPVDDPVIDEPTEDDPTTDNPTDDPVDEPTEEPADDPADEPADEPVHSHVAVYYEATEAACSKEGNKEYWRCSECGKYFSDEACSIETTEDELVLPKTAHSYKDGYCSVCGEKDPDYVPPSPSEGLSYTLSDDGAYYILSGLGTCSDTDIVIPSTYENLPVKEIASYAFCAFALESFESLGSNIISVIVSDGVEVVGEGAFYGCTSLVGVSLPDSLTSVGDYAFACCESLIGITVPNGVTLIGASAFYGCYSLANVNLGSGVTSIGDGAFYLCDGLKDITIPDGVSYIGASAFRGCSSLSNVKMGGGVVNIGVYAFGGCVSLAEISLPKSLASIGENAFVSCKALKNITVDNDCANYKSVDGNLYSKDGSELILYAAGKTDTAFSVPDGVTTISGGAFYNCRALESITLPESLTSVGDYAFGWCASLKSVIIPDGVISLGNGAFENCSSLTEVTIGEGVNKIGVYAFHNCALLGKAEFKNVVGWTAGGESISSDVLTDPLSAAACFTVNYYWLAWERN